MAWDVSVDAAVARAGTLVDVLRLRAAAGPTRRAYVFLADGERDEAVLTYAELEARARAVAAYLLGAGAAGQRVLLVFPPGLDYVAAFLGCLAAGAVAVPVYPPRANRSLERLASIAVDSRPRLALTDDATLRRVEPLVPACAALAALPWKATGSLTDAGLHELPLPGPEELAFLQYTSGSTAEPKGVCVTHANLIHNQRVIRELCGHSAESTFVSWLPMYHDMGLIGTVLQPLYLGALSVLMAPAAFLQKPVRWLEAVSRYGAHTSGGPNSAFELCLRKITAEQRRALDLRSWRVAFNGSEPVSADTIERFAQAFAPAGFRREAFYPCYGLAEATLMVSGGVPGRAPAVVSVQAADLERHRATPADGNAAARRLVSCGQPAAGQRVVVVNPERQPCPDGEVGEIWVAGPSVAQGYWGRDEASREFFDARLADGSGPFLRTGDLGVWLGGRLHVTGRLKDLVIIRGANYYPHDIENSAASSHPALVPGHAAAFAVEAEGEERLTVVVEAARRRLQEGAPIARAVRRAVAADHDVEPHAVVVVPPGALPRTSSGKVRRGACRASFQDGTLATLFEWRAADAALADLLGPADPLAAEASRPTIEAWLRRALAARTGATEGSVDPDQPLLAHGLDSLGAMDLAQAVEAHCGVSVPIERLFDGMSLAELAELAAARPPQAGVDGEAPRAVPAPNAPEELSDGQRALWFLHRLAPDSAAYNVAACARLLGPLDVEALRRATSELVAAHASLHTVFPERDGRPVARRTAPELDFAVEPGAPDASTLRRRFEEEGRRPFALEHGPLLRVRLAPAPEGGHVLLLVAHHIILDLVSVGVLLRELAAGYAALRSGRPLPRAGTRASDYASFVAWQRALAGSAEGRRQARFWRRRLEGLQPLDLPLDRPRPARQSHDGALLRTVFTPQLAEAVGLLGRNRGVTPATVLLTGFLALLARYAGRTDVAVGVPTSGRRRAEHASAVGYCVNPVVVRVDLAGDPTFTEMLERTRRVLAEAMAHADYPFAKVVEELAPARDPTRAPLFQVLFAFQQPPPGTPPELGALALGDPQARLDLGELQFAPWPLDAGVAQFDLTLAAAPSSGGLSVELEYATALFEPGTITRLAGHLRTLLVAAVHAPETRFSRLPLLDASERRRVLVEWNPPPAVAVEGCVPDLFARQAALTPTAPAVACDEHVLTYAELDRRSNAIAHRLAAAGVSREVPVGLYAPRGLDHAAGVLGIMKSGGVAVPLDPAYPADHLGVLVSDAGVRTILAPRAAAEAAGGLGRPLVWIEDSLAPVEAAAGRALPDGLAYVVYTSGSTGQPKGVGVPHGALARHVLAAAHLYGLGAGDRVLQFAGIGLDVAYEQLLPGLLRGACIVQRGAALWTPGEFPEQVAARRLTVVDFTTAYWHAVVNEPGALERLLGVAHLRLLTVGGDALSAAAVPAPLRRGLRFINLYGPTEAVISSSALELGSGAGDAAPRGGSVSIGRPLAHRAFYVLDGAGEPVPPGVTGEIVIGGPALARGYVGRPRQTAERFVPDPFGTLAGARLYRTGDLGRQLPDGRIQFVGRRDRQVKLRGFRLELEDVEAQLTRVPGVAQAVALAEGDRLLACVTARPGASLGGAEIRAALGARLPAYMVPSAVSVLERLPVTAGGKVDRAALAARAAEFAASADGTGTGPGPAPRDECEARLAALFAEVLKRPAVGVHDGFFDLGGHSLLAAQLVSRVEREFHRRVPLQQLFETPTVAGLAASLRRAPAVAGGAPPRRLPRDAPLPLSFAQERLWFLHQLAPDSPLYNCAGALRLRGRLDAEALRRALCGVAARHETLRTRFIERGGRPAQVIDARAEVELPRTVLAGDPAGREAAARRLAAEEARVPFDLARGPLLRARLFQLAADDHVLVACMHHIVSDGWSVSVVARELAALYAAAVSGTPPPLAEPAFQYADYAAWQREHLGGDVLDEQLAYWRRQLAGVPGGLELPADRPAPARPSFRGGVEAVRLTSESSAAAAALARASGVTLFTVLLACFKALLVRVTGQRDLVVGTAVAGRDLVETEGLIGFFVNMLALRTEAGAETTFAQLVERVGKVVLEAQAHQMLPFERLVEDLRPGGGRGHAPLVQVAFGLDNAPREPWSLPDLEVEAWRVDEGVARYDLTLWMREEADGLHGVWTYSLDRFERATVVHLAEAYSALLADAVRRPQARLGDLELLESARARRDDGQRAALRAARRRPVRLAPADAGGRQEG